MTIALIAAMAVLAALAVWRVARRAWDYLAIALLAVAAMPLVAAGPTGDMSRYLPSAFSGGPDGVGEIALESALSTFFVAVILAAACLVDRADVLASLRVAPRGRAAVCYGRSRVASASIGYVKPVKTSLAAIVAKVSLARASLSIGTQSRMRCSAEFASAIRSAWIRLTT